METSRSLALSVLLSVTLCTAEPSSNWKRNIEYFQDVKINCSDGNIKFDDANVQFWILPSGEILRPPDEQAVNVKILHNGSQLEIHKLDDVDFGLYLCVVKVNNGSIEAIKKGINIDGPYYGEETIRGYKRKAVIGGIAAGVAFGLIVILCLLCSLCKHTGKSDIEKGSSMNKENTVTELSTATETTIAGLQMVETDLGTGQASPTKIGDSIYDTADSMIERKVDVDAENHVMDKVRGKDVESIKSDSGHYQSIGSLERDLKPLYGHNEEEMEGETVSEKMEVNGDVTEPGTDEPDPSISSEVTCISKDKLSVSEDSGSMEKHDAEMSDSSEKETQSLDLGASDKDIGDDQASNNDESGDEENLLETQNGDHPIYSKPIKRLNQSRSDKVDVVVVQGEIILESTGVSVPVTTAPAIFTQNSETTPSTSRNESAINDQTDGVFVNDMSDRENKDNEVSPETYNGGIMQDNNEVMEEELVDSDAQQSGDRKTKGVSNDGSNNGNENGVTTEEIRHNADNEMKCDDEAVTKKKKISSVSSSCSETSKSTVDEETVANFENVLASLVMTHKRNSASSLGSGSDKSDKSPAVDSINSVTGADL